MKTPTLAITAAALLGLGGCTTLVNEQASGFQSPVSPVMTEHSLALSCLGGLIERSGRPALTVFVEDVPDTTVPRSFEERRLSSGGAWWLHTAINRLGTARVRSASADRAKPGGNHIVLEGAWTQDDTSVGKGGADVGGRRRTGSGLLDLGFGFQRRADVIAGDFLSSRNGHVLHASAISVTVNASGASLGLRIEDGRNSLGVDLGNNSSDGPQFAQRRIAEAAVLVHVAHAFNVDYRPCIETAWASPTGHTANVQAYGRMSASERHRAVQQALARAGHAPGAMDGVWGEQSARALMRFQAAHKLPVTGRHSAEVYAEILRHARAQ
ncbi:peptidoglycan-binding domain 1 protein [Thauera sp. 28]|uniref:peptidoglycan-binding domain-containing protein n=1 Tax=Thauera sp. 28 TaxID=303682 RepID=UPI0002CFF390|nr:peptidoglycan-binding domain-containing protein [Thauera sp. 28]ENO91035.1 peptidoglycan-binding domain 1 protein [Thauera sp. 28]